VSTEKLGLVVHLAKLRQSEFRRPDPNRLRPSPFLPYASADFAGYKAEATPREDGGVHRRPWHPDCAGPTRDSAPVAMAGPVMHRGPANEDELLSILSVPRETCPKSFGPSMS
jgi:hypothetical protein